MHHMTNTGWLKFSPLRRAGRSRKKFEEDDLCGTGRTNVNEEYLEAFRTKSFIDISKKVQRQLGKISSRTNSSATSLPFFTHLTDYLLEPRQEIVTNITHSFYVHHLLVDYFQASLEAGRYCDQILERIYQLRLCFHKITRVIQLSKIVLDDDANDQTQKDIYGELALFTSQNNPSAIISPLQFREIHDRYMVLLHRLKSKRWKIRRRITFKRFCKKIGGIGLVISHSALLIALLILAFHSIVGIVAAPSIVGGLIGLFRKKSKWPRRRLSTYSSERLCEQLDVAAKGIYILINELNTLSRMVKRIHDEVEHQKAIADVCIKNGKWEILKQVVKEFHEHESSFLDQLEELEEHIYLCSYYKQVQKTRYSRNYEETTINWWILPCTLKIPINNECSSTNKVLSYGDYRLKYLIFWHRKALTCGSSFFYWLIFYDMVAVPIDSIFFFQNKSIQFISIYNDYSFILYSRFIDSK